MERRVVLEKTVRKFQKTVKKINILSGPLLFALKIVLPRGASHSWFYPLNIKFQGRVVSEKTKNKYMGQIFPLRLSKTAEVG